MRYYDPEIGRYISRDPAGYADGLNVYLYVHNNPINHIDPLGLGYWGDVGDVYMGYGDAAVSMASGVYTMGRHPITTAEGIGTAIAHPVQAATAIGNSYAEKAGTLRGQGEIAGEILITVATMSAGAAEQGTSKAAEVAKVAEKIQNAASKEEAAANVASQANKVEKVTEDTAKVAEDVGKTGVNPEGGAKTGDNVGRTGRQARLREIADDPNASAADRGWIKQEMNSIERGQRDTIRNPPGKDLAHEPGREAAKGYSYDQSNLQDRDLHKLQHKFDDFGRANKERPLRPDEQ